MKYLFLLSLFSFVFGFTFAHPGNTDSSGCHTCRTNCTSWGLSYGQYHCHTPKVYVPSYNYTKPQTCSDKYGIGATSDGYGGCECGYGYVANGSSCELGSIYCRSLHGLHSTYDSLSKTCECSYGYVVYNNKCIDEDAYCENLFGYNSSYNILKDSCVCDYGYFFNGSNCVKDSSTSSYSYVGGSYGTTKFDTTSYDANEVSCPDNASVSSNGNCYCDDGYMINKDKDGCITMNTYCRNEYGSNITVEENETGDLVCTCKKGYYFDQKEASCKNHQNYCVDTYGIYSESKENNENDLTCVCSEGYVLNTEDNRCVSYNKECENKYGEYSYSKGLEDEKFYCYCDESHMRNEDKSKCVAINNDEVDFEGEKKGDITNDKAKLVFNIIDKNYNGYSEKTKIEKYESLKKVFESILYKIKNKDTLFLINSLNLIIEERIILLKG